jgi:hypothetical protein
VGLPVGLLLLTFVLVISYYFAIAPLYRSWQAHQAELREQKAQQQQKEQQQTRVLLQAQAEIEQKLADKEKKLAEIAANKELEVQRLKVREANLVLERQKSAEQAVRQLASDEATRKERAEASHLALQERLKREERQRLEAQQEEEQRRIRNERSAKEAVAIKVAAIEVKAQGRLKIANKLMEEGNYPAGKNRLEMLIRDFPDSEAAKEAKKIVPSK